MRKFGKPQNLGNHLFWGVVEFLNPQMELVKDERASWKINS